MDFGAINNVKVSEISGEINENNELVLTINGVTGSGIPLPDNQIKLTPVFYPDYLSYSSHSSTYPNGGNFYFKQGGQFNPTVLGLNVGGVVLSGFEIERYYSSGSTASYYSSFLISTNNKSRLFTELGLNKLPDGIYDVTLINLFKFETSLLSIPELHFKGDVLHTTLNPTSFTVENGILTAHNDKNISIYESNYATSTQELIVAVSCIRKYWSST